MHKLVYLSILLIVVLFSCKDDEIIPISDPTAPSSFYITYEIDGNKYEYKRAINNYFIEMHTAQSTNQDSSYYEYACEGKILNGISSDTAFDIIMYDYIKLDNEVTHFDQAFSIGNILYRHLTTPKKDHDVEFQIRVDGLNFSSRKSMQDASSYFTITNSEEIYNSYAKYKAITGNFSCYVKGGFLDSVKVENGQFKLPFGVFE